ncbi:MAG TPA: FAD-dependent oxidoreductase [Gammaproteobacteria bacterium]|nr:FAD-dependent oxidoreductase [Gammaproteobacteria bacterium]
MSKISVDYLVVGSGVTGATIARQLTDEGHEVMVLERRQHVAGNAHDTVHSSGIRYHTYGPHYFRTSSSRIWEFVNRFADFYKFEGVLQTDVNGQLERWPVHKDYIRKHVGENWEPEFKGQPGNFEEAALSIMPRLIYERFIEGYTRKQWGVLPTQLEPWLAKRFDVSTDDDLRLKKHRYQGIPLGGYEAWAWRMLDGIDCQLGVDYLKERDRFHARKKVIFTGPVDEYFGYDLGPLAYRGQRRSLIFIPNVDYVYQVPQINCPDIAAGPHVRILEWKHTLPEEERNVQGSLLTVETPFTPDDPGDYEYPFPSTENNELYKRYEARAKALDNVLICGRLGEYRYFDMDQAIARAFVHVDRLLGRRQD